MIDIIPKIDPDLIFPVLNYEPIYRDCKIVCVRMNDSLNLFL